MQYATFFVADGTYAIPILLVEEFLRPATVTRVPLSDARIEGLINLRGKTATVLDMRRCLGKPPAEPEAKYKLILLERHEDLTEEAVEFDIESHEEPVVLRVDRIGRILNFAREEVHPPPAHIKHAFVDGVVRIDEAYITVLSVRGMIEEILKTEGNGAALPAGV